MVNGYFYNGRNFTNEAKVVDEDHTGKTKRYIKYARVALLSAFVIFFLVGVIHTVAIGTNQLVHWVKVTNAAGVEKAINHYDQEVIIVDAGDTAWNLQKALVPDEDVRSTLSLAAHLNPGVNLGDIQAGDIIVLLKEKQK